MNCMSMDEELGVCFILLKKQRVKRDKKNGESIFEITVLHFFTFIRMF